MHHPQFRSRLKRPVYALEHTPTGALINTGCGVFLPSLAPLHRACLAHATPEGRAWLIQKAADYLVPFGVPHELVRLEPAPADQQEEGR